MIGLAASTRIWIVAGVTDMRRGFVGLSGMVQTALKENPFSGQVFVFRGKRGDLIKLLWWDGDGLGNVGTDGKFSDKLSAMANIRTGISRGGL